MATTRTSKTAAAKPRTTRGKAAAADQPKKYRHTPGYCKGCGVDIFDPANQTGHGTVAHDPKCPVENEAIERRNDLRRRLAHVDAIVAQQRAERAEVERASRPPRPERTVTDVHDYVRGERNRCATCGGARNIKAHTHIANKEA